MSTCCHEKRTWRFASADETTAANVIREIAGFVGDLSMRVCFPLSSVELVTVSGSPPDSVIEVGEPTVSEDDCGVAIVPILSATEGTYTIVLRFNDQQLRRGVFLVEPTVL